MGKWAPCSKYLTHNKLVVFDHELQIFNWYPKVKYGVSNMESFYLIWLKFGVWGYGNAR